MVKHFWVNHCVYCIFKLEIAGFASTKNYESFIAYLLYLGSELGHDVSKFVPVGFDSEGFISVSESVYHVNNVVVSLDFEVFEALIHDVFL